MAKEFKITTQYLGYQSKKDITNVDVRFLGSGSKNVLISDGEKITSSPGYSLDGPADSGYSGGSNGKCDWITSKESERNLRVLKSGKIQYRYVDENGDVTYRDLMSVTAGSKVRFAEDAWWSSTEVDDLLPFVVGNSNLYIWSGGITTIASATSNSITKNGTLTWKEEKFTTTGKVTIGGTDYTYTGGAGTTTLTGVTPDPSALVANSIAHQTVTTVSNVIGSGYNVNYVGINKNQIYLGSNKARTVYVSKNSSYSDYSYTAPRLPGEGAELTLDASCRGFVAQEEAMYIAAGKDMWFQTQFTLSSDNKNEALTVSRLKSGPQQAAFSQEMIAKIKNSVVFVSNEPTFDTLGRVENINTPQSVPLSDPIKIEFSDYDFSEGNIVFFQNQTFISLPAEGLVLIYDHQNNYWQPPQTLSVVLAIIGGKLYGHSTILDESYLLFDKENYTFNGSVIESVAKVVYNSFGNRPQQKRFDEYYIEGYATKETKVLVDYLFDYNGYTKTIEGREIDLSNNKIVFDKQEETGSLGKESLGKSPFGGIMEDVVDMPKFRTIQTLNLTSFYEFSVVFHTNTENYNWSIIAHGPNVMLSTAESLSIKT